MVKTIATTLSACSPECSPPQSVSITRGLMCDQELQEERSDGFLTWDTSPECPASSLNNRLYEVNIACCYESVCDHGTLETCSLDCATDLIPFYEDCRDTIDSSFDADDGDEDGVAAGFSHAAAICSSMDISVPITRLNRLLSEGCDVDTDGITSTSDVGRHLQISDILSRAVNQSRCSLETFNSR
eukprot:SAG11_NODE_12144_length_719_cov_293.996774_2_plen_186_part_01